MPNDTAELTFTVATNSNASAGSGFLGTTDTSTISGFSSATADFCGWVNVGASFTIGPIAQPSGIHIAGEGVDVRGSVVEGSYVQNDLGNSWLRLEGILTEGGEARPVVWDIPPGDRREFAGQLRLTRYFAVDGALTDRQRTRRQAQVLRAETEREAAEVRVVADRERERREAIERAEAILREHIGEDRFEELRQVGYIELDSRRHEGRRYRIHSERDHVIQVLDTDGAVVDRLCIHPDVRLPDADEVLARVVLLENAEEFVLQTANHHGPGGDQIGVLEFR